MRCLGLTGAMGIIGLCLLIAGLTDSPGSTKKYEPPGFFDEWGAPILLAVAGSIWWFFHKRSKRREREAYKKHMEEQSKQ